MSSNNISNLYFKKINWGTVWFIFQLIVLLFVAALGNWFTKDLDPSYIFSKEWWGDTLTQIMFNYSILYLMFNRRLSKLYVDNSEYLEYKIKLKKEVDNLDPNTFNPWFDKFNLNQKIKHFRNHISRKLEKLEHKVTPNDINIWENGNPEQKTKNKYCVKRSRLELQLTDEYIKKNIRLINVGYKNIKKSFITNGYNSSGNNANTYHIENGVTKFVRDLIPRTLLTTAAVLILRSIVIDLVDTDNILLLVFQTLITIVPMILHSNLGTQYGDQYFQEKILVDSRTREEIISLFYNETRKVGEVNGS